MSGRPGGAAQTELRYGELPKLLKNTIDQLGLSESTMIRRD